MIRQSPMSNSRSTSRTPTATTWPPARRPPPTPTAITNSPPASCPASTAWWKRRRAAISFGVASSIDGTVTSASDLTAITVQGGDNSVHNDFALVKPITLSGTVYWDMNDNGVLDLGEPGIGSAKRRRRDGAGAVCADLGNGTGPGGRHHPSRWLLVGLRSSAGTIRGLRRTGEWILPGLGHRGHRQRHERRHGPESGRNRQRRHAAERAIGCELRLRRVVARQHQRLRLCRRQQQRRRSTRAKPPSPACNLRCWMPRAIRPV